MCRLYDAGADSDSGGTSIPSTPTTPKISIRDRISSKISAHKQKRKAVKDASKENKKKETRDKVEKVRIVFTFRLTYFCFESDSPKLFLMFG